MITFLKELAATVTKDYLEGIILDALIIEIFLNVVDMTMKILKLVPYAVFVVEAKHVQVRDY